MSNSNYQVSLERIKKVVPEELLTNALLAAIDNSGERMSQIIVDKKDNGNDYYLTIHRFFVYSNEEFTAFDKEDVADVEFVNGTPDGEVIITLKDGKVLHPSHICYGRAFDFIQDVKPKVITMAGYDSTIRGEFPQLLDPDHAEEIDRLRRWMQDGNISHYEYDDANPAYPKAGK
uniref:Protein HdcB n=1 Tax=Lactobacillus sp. (strain 30a) TaxID=1593 RepID=HDCB_LACS3|nr:RecName: Full=Protein HdcB [Lactobacillus sp. 30A]CAA31491.1 unnamed protein product [Lactobacillus sp. 30A]